MNEKEIVELLDLADATAAPAGQPGADLARRAVRQARRRTALKRTGLAVHAVAAVAVVVFVFLPERPAAQPGSDRAPIATVITQDIENQLAELRAKVVAQEAIIEALLACEEQADAYESVIQAVNPLADIHAQADLAAKRMVLAAERMERSRGRNDFSDRLYRDVATDFPDSDWATIARNRISEYQSHTEPRSAL